MSDIRRREFITLLRRALQRAFGHKPTVLEEYQLTKAAALMSKVERAAVDPGVSPEESASASGAAERAFSDVSDIIKARHREKQNRPAVAARPVSVTTDIAGLLP
jgi:hypothetical protein